MYHVSCIMYHVYIIYISYSLPQMNRFLKNAPLLAIDERVLAMSGKLSNAQMKGRTSSTLRMVVTANSFFASIEENEGEE